MHPQMAYLLIEAYCPDLLDKYDPDVLAGVLRRLDEYPEMKNQPAHLLIKVLRVIVREQEQRG